MSVYILFAMAALGIGGGLFVLWREWRIQTWPDRWKAKHPNGMLYPLGGGYMVIPECRYIGPEEEETVDVVELLWPEKATQ